MSFMTENTLGPTKEMDADALSVFEQVKHDILHKIWQLHKDDELHNLNEIRKVEHIKYFKPIAYRTQEMPNGVNYFGKILLDESDCVHVRVFKPFNAEDPVIFHALHNKPLEAGGAVFKMTDEITYFEY